MNIPGLTALRRTIDPQKPAGVNNAGAEQPGPVDAHVGTTGTKEVSNLRTKAEYARTVVMAAGLGVAGLLSGSLTHFAGAGCAFLAVGGGALALGSGLRLHGKLSAILTGGAGFLALGHGLSASSGDATLMAGLLGGLAGVALSEQISDGRLQTHLKSMFSWGAKAD